MISPEGSLTSSIPAPHPHPPSAVSPARPSNHRSSRSFGNIKEKRASLSVIPPLPPAETKLPSKPFATRYDSPVSSIGDSSSGRAPYTPKDGSDVSVGAAVGTGAGVDTKGSDSRWGGGVSGLGVDGRGRPLKRRSMSVVEDGSSLLPYDIGKGKSTNDGGGVGKKKEKWVSVEREEEAEARRKERRRGEAKAAIELGNVINGRGPMISGDDDDDDDDDEDLPINQALAGRMNPMVGLGPLPPPRLPMGFNSPVGPGVSPGWMPSPSPFMAAPPTDPAMFAAHQQAMMHAKYTYQMAVAQQAMAAAGDEWERGSAIGGGAGGGSVYGGGSIYGGGGSVYGGGNTGSVYGGMSSPMSMYGGMPQMGWSPAATMFPPAPASMFGGGVAQSDYGGGGGQGGQFSSSRSVYGENFGPSQRNSRLFNPRESGYFPSMPSAPPPPHGRGSSGLKSGPTTPRSRTTSSPAQPTRGTPSRVIPEVPRRAPPPSSWKA